jgi:PIN domain nuclease of toxin-antitoxin system
MKYLLDTHTAMWALDDYSRLSDTAKSVINDTSLHLCVSIVSAWEIAVKVNIGKLDLTGGSLSFIDKLEQFGIEIVGIDKFYLKLFETLPLLHRDPFDRLLVATAKAEGMTILTADEYINKYDVKTLW